MPVNDSYDSYTEAQLLEMLKDSDSEAFTEIYHRYAEQLYRFAFKILEQENECENVVQDVFVWLWENRTRVQITALKYYLLSAVKYKMIRTIQKSKRRAEILAQVPVEGPAYYDNALELEQLKAVIRHFTQRLPPRARQIFELSRNEYLSNREIAVKLNITEKTVENQITIVLRKLRRSLGHLPCWFLFL